MLTALLTGLGLGVLVAAQVGPVSLLCVRTTLRYGFAPGLAVGAVLMIVGLATLSWPTWAAGLFVLVTSVVADEHHKRGLRRPP